MKKRSYQQYCPIAYGLDVIGERWTLLIVRELSLGVRRFSDLQRGLPTLGANLLSQRLKSLEASGVVMTAPLPPPARITAYQLTEAGWALLEAMQPLVQWGLRFMPKTIPDDDFLGAIPAMLGLTVMYQPTLEEGETLSAEIRIEPDIFRVVMQPEQITVEQGYLPDAHIAFQAAPKVILHLARAGYPPEVSPEKVDILIVRGDPTLIGRFFEQFTNFQRSPH